MPKGRDSSESISFSEIANSFRGNPQITPALLRTVNSEIDKEVSRRRKEFLGRLLDLRELRETVVDELCAAVEKVGLKRERLKELLASSHSRPSSGPPSREKQPNWGLKKPDWKDW